MIWQMLAALGAKVVIDGIAGAIDRSHAARTQKAILDARVAVLEAERARRGVARLALASARGARGDPRWQEALRLIEKELARAQ